MLHTPASPGQRFSQKARDKPGQQQVPDPPAKEAIMLSDAPLRYRIILRGECGNVLQGMVGDATIESQRGWTCVIVTVGGEAGFYELLNGFQDLALQVVSINQLDADAAGAEGVRAVPAGRDRPQPRAGLRLVSQPADPPPASW